MDKRVTRGLCVSRVWCSNEGGVKVQVCTQETNVYLDAHIHLTRDGWYCTTPGCTVETLWTRLSSEHKEIPLDRHIKHDIWLGLREHFFLGDISAYTLEEIPRDATRYVSGDIVVCTNASPHAFNMSL